jgi:hypothetical protein
VDDRQNKVLLYTRTAGPRHANISPALGSGLNPPLGAGASDNVLQKAIIKWMGEQGVTVDWTEDVNTLAGALGPSSRYKAVIFASTSRDTLWKHGTAISATAAVNTTTNVFRGDDVHRGGGVGEALGTLRYGGNDDVAQFFEGKIGEIA